MHEQLFCALDQGASVVTSTHRLARVLTARFHRRARTLSRAVWSIPNILPLDAFLERQWRSWLLNGADGECPRLLDAAQEQIIWEQIILDSPEGDTLLQIPATARTAMEAWQLIHAYRLPVDGRFEAHDDWAAFRGWAQKFRERCQTNQWLERARLSDFLRERIAAGEVSGLAAIYAAGFEDPTPQQAELFEVLKAQAVGPEPDFDAPVERRKAAEEGQELAAVAEWARRLIERESDAQIGVVVPNLTRLRSKVTRVFRETIEAGWASSESERLFHVSLGPPLADEPAVRVALLALEFAVDQLSLPRAGTLLRSPFLGSGEAEASKRALLDAKLRGRGMWDVSVAGLKAVAESCPLLQHTLERLDQERKKLPERQSATGWSQSFSRVLKALGWPGDRSLTSREYQLMEAWGDLLSAFAALDLALPPVTFASALVRLREMASHVPFQIADEGAPIQILGPLEAAGMEFDHLWIMGLDDETFPGAASPNPFLPLALQRQQQLPHCSPDRELAFARAQITRLLRSAPDIRISYSETAGDRALAPSPLIAAGTWKPVDTKTAFTDWIADVRASVRTEPLEDFIAPPAKVDATQSGGTSLFKDMAACPFRAFAKHRLHAKPIEDPVPGLSYRDRGSTVHTALELIWSELGSHARLMELRPDDLRGLIARHAETAVRKLGLGAALERKRLERLLAEWLEIEKSRDPFVVCHTEHKRLAVISGLQVQTRADRVDRIADGREIIVDYKTGQVTPNGWRSDRPDEPQLPLYCVTNEAPVAGAAFAVIHTGELAFRGLTDGDVSLPEMKKMTVDQPGAFRDEVARWKHALADLAENFRAGLAEVDPKPKACENCGLTALCRIQEYEGDRG